MSKFIRCFTCQKDIYEWVGDPFTYIRSVDFFSLNPEEYGTPKDGSLFCCPVCGVPFCRTSILDERTKPTSSIDSLFPRLIIPNDKPTWECTEPRSETLGLVLTCACILICALVFGLFF